MGYYTELYLDCEIDSSLLNDAEKEIVEYLFNTVCFDNDTPTNLPNHYFFKCSRWSMVGRGGSAYFDDTIPRTLTKNNNIWSIVSRSDFKNYDDEIELFLDWFTPCIIKKDDKCIGHQQGEEDEEPTLIYI